MKTRTSVLLDQIGEAFSFAALLTPALAMAFPLVAWMDGAEHHYAQLSILCMVCALFVALPVAIALGGISSFFSGFETRAIRKMADARDERAYQNYLLNGGRA